MPKRVCVDLNGVLDTYRGWQGRVTWHPPREGAAEFLRALRERGHEVVVLTTRDAEDADRWLRRSGLWRHVDRVTDRKLPALAYVDDRALPFRGSYARVLRRLERFRPFWDAPVGEGPPASLPAEERHGRPCAGESDHDGG